MAELTVQLNHPGSEKEYHAGDEYKENSGFYHKDGVIIREWNCENHCRKLLRQKGCYIENITDIEAKKAELLFWGEWEGCSIYHPENGIHEPFYSDNKYRGVNTDPYVFGDAFKYCFCSQTGVMKNLDKGSLILFGTTVKEAFLLDTVFVVSGWEDAEKVKENKAANYSTVYKKSVLQRLEDIYDDKSQRQTGHRLYKGRQWQDDKTYFSYFPCKLGDAEGGGKVSIPLESEGSELKFSTNRQGHLFNTFEGTDPAEVWEIVTEMVIEQGFYLGVSAEEPEENYDLAPDNVQLAADGKPCGQSSSGIGCSKTGMPGNKAKPKQQGCTS